MTAPEGAGESGRARREVTISNRRGLHARAAAQFVKCAERFEADISVARQDTTVSGRSIMGLMMLAAGPGTVITLEAAGREAEVALAALADLVDGKFGED